MSGYSPEARRLAERLADKATRNLRRAGKTVIIASDGTRWVQRRANDDETTTAEDVPEEGRK